MQAMGYVNKPECSFIEVLTRLRELSVCRFYIPIRDCKYMEDENYMREIITAKCGKCICFGVYIIWCGYGACGNEDKVLYIGMSGKLNGNQYGDQDIIKRIPNTKTNNESADKWCEKLKKLCDKNLYIEVLCLDTTKERQSIITPACAEAYLLESYERSYGDLPPANSQKASVEEKCKV